MADNKKYYYLRLKDNFFDSDEMIILESMQDGYIYCNILLKLYLRSLKFDGRLMFNERIPYNSEILATVTRHKVGVIEKALKIFNELGLIEILDNGAIYMTDIQTFIGKSSTEADRKREYRQQIENEKQLLLGQTVGQMSRQISDKSTPEKEREKETEYRDKKESQYQKIFSDDSFEMKCVKFLITSLQLEMPSTKIPSNDKDIDKWCEHIEKMIRLDKRTTEDIYRTLEYARSDSFWKANIRSTSKFREKYETLYSQMKSRQNQQLSKPKATNKFNDFPQREYSDMESLEQRLLHRS